jgi:tRNA pseudouridine55 synthase
MVYDLRMTGFDEQAQTARLVALTGKGTYVRKLVEDLGSATGAGGYAAALRRTRIGSFTVDQALKPDELLPERYPAGGPGVLTLDEALDFLPRHELSGREARLASNGNELTGAPIGRFRVYGPAGLVGVYEGRGGAARPVVIFPGRV